MKIEPDMITIRDDKRDFSESDKLRKYNEQNGICAATGIKMDYHEMVGGHIIAYCKGGLTIYDNLVMISRAANEEMGATNFNDYIEMKKMTA
jgi:CRISPR/Cas system Type II protein with McrA/HNH and RuvC-like nuclease domain